MTVLPNAKVISFFVRATALSEKKSDEEEEEYFDRDRLRSVIYGLLRQVRKHCKS